MQRSRGPAELERHHARRARRLCLASFSVAGLIYLASPFLSLWSLAGAVTRDDQTALRSDCDWERVRDGLKRSLGLPGLQKASDDELPAFGESFAAGVASGMIDEDVSPARLGEILRNPVWRHGAGARLPRGTFVAPARFEATIPTAGGEPIVIDLAVEKWRWKVVHVSIPQRLMQEASSDGTRS